MARRMPRRTMGQDWGGRRKLNPDDAPKVTRKEVLDCAASLGIQVRREGLGMWFYRCGETWYTLGQTNYLAQEQLMRIEADDTSH